MLQHHLAIITMNLPYFTVTTEMLRGNASALDMRLIIGNILGERSPFNGHP